VPRTRFFTISLHLPTFAWDGLEAFEIGSDRVRHFDCMRDDLGEARPDRGALHVARHHEGHRGQAQLWQSGRHA
jgi:hypothetical protein